MKVTRQQSAQTAPKADSQPAAPAHATLAQQVGNTGLLRILQAKLVVGDPQDHFEQEADRIADQVMRMPDAAVAGAPALASPRTTAVQRAADATSGLPVVDAGLEEAVASLDARGGPLSADVRSFMEPRFGADLSAVRIHTDAHAHNLARSVNARAFTVGHNVVFGAGYYAPQTDSGRRLIAHELTHTLQQGASTRLARTPTSGGDDGGSPGPRETNATQPYPTIKRLGPYTYASQEVNDHGTAHWRVWNWARIGGPSKDAGRGPQHFLEQLVALARDAGNDMLVLTIENIEAPSVQRLSKKDSPMAKHLGAISVERVNDTTIRWVIPLGGTSQGGTDGGSGGAVAPRPRMVAHDSPEAETVVGGSDREPSQSLAQPRGAVVVGGPGREPDRTTDAPKDRVVVGGLGREPGRTSDEPRDPVVVGGFGRDATRPVDVPEQLSPSDGVPVSIPGPDDPFEGRTNPVPRTGSNPPTPPGTASPGEAVPEHIDDGPNVHRPPAPSPTPSGSTASRPRGSTGSNTPPGSTPPRTPASTAPESSGGSGSTPPGSTLTAGSSTPPGTTNEVSGRSPVSSSQTADPFASTPPETPTPRDPSPRSSDPLAPTPQETPTQVQSGTPTQVPTDNLFKGERGGAAERLAPAVERVSMDQWVHPIQKIGEGINTKFLLVDAVTGERWLFKPAAGEQDMRFGPELGIRTGERWRRALAAAYLAQDLGLNTPYVRLIEMEGMVGSLQEWRQGYEARPLVPGRVEEARRALYPRIDFRRLTRPELEAIVARLSGSRTPPTVEFLRELQNKLRDFDSFWNSRFRHDIDAFDYFIANQDRHQYNVMKRNKGDRPETMLIDQDAGMPASPERFSRQPPPTGQSSLGPWQRDLPPSVSIELAERFRDLAARFPEAELRKWLTEKEVDGLWSRLNEVVEQLNDGRIGIIEESPTRAAETSSTVASPRRTASNAASGTFSSSGSTQDVASGTFSTGAATETSGSKTGSTGSPTPTPSPSSGSAATTAPRTPPATESGAPTTAGSTESSRTPSSGEAPLPKAAVTVAPGPEPPAGHRSNVQVTAADAINIDKDIERQTPQGPRQTSMGASASGQAVTVDVRTGGPGRQTTGAVTVTGQDIALEVGRQKPGKGGPTAGIRLDSQGNPTFEAGWAFQTKGGSSIKPTFSHGTRVDAREPLELEDGRFVVAYTMTETTTAGVGGAARRTPQGRPGFALGGNFSQFEAESKQGTRIFKTKQEAEAFRNTAAVQLAFDRSTAAPATSEEALMIPVGETRGQGDTEGRNVGLSASFGGTTLGRNWQKSDTTGLSFYRVSGDLLNVTATYTQDKAKDWGIGALVLANQKGGDTTEGFGVTLQFNLSLPAGREALDFYLKTRIPPASGARIVSVMVATGEGSYDRYQMPALGTAAWSDRAWQKETRGEDGVTKEFGGEQVHQQDPTWLAELTGDRELYSSAQLISQQIRGKEAYTAIINIKSESGEYNREQFGKIFMGAKTSGPVEQSGAWTLSAEIAPKVVHELEQVSSKFKDAKNRDDKQRILSEVFRKQGASMAGGLVRSGGGFMLSWDLELKGDPNFPGPAGRHKLVVQREELAKKLKTPDAAAQVVRETQDVLNRLWARRKGVSDERRYTDLPKELRQQQVALIDRHIYEFNQLRSNALMAAGKRDPNESIEAIRARMKNPKGYDKLKPETRELARLQDHVADKDASINEIRSKIVIGLEAVRRARLLDSISPKLKPHLVASIEAMREVERLHKKQSDLGPGVQDLRVRAFNVTGPQAQIEAWRQLDAALSGRYGVLTLEMHHIEEAGKEKVPITKPESRWGARYDEFWAPLEDVADEEPEYEDVPASFSMTLEEKKPRKRGRRR